MRRQTKRRIAVFAHIQALKPQYMISQKTKADVYTEAYMGLLKGASGDKIIS